MKLGRYLLIGVIFVLALNFVSNAKSSELILCTKANLSDLCFAQGINTSAIEKPPVSFTILKASYNGIVKEDFAIITAVYEIYVTANEWVEIPLLAEDIAAKDFALDKEDILTLKDGKYRLVTNKSGLHRVEITFLAKIHKSDSYNELKFAIPKAAISKLNFEIPKKNISIFIPSAFDIKVIEAETGTKITATISVKESFYMKWSKRLEIPKIEKLESKIYSEVYNLLAIKENLLQGNVIVKYSILRSEANHFKISLPKDLEILTVRGLNIKDWQVLAEKEEKILNVYLSPAVKGSYKLEISYEKSLNNLTYLEIPELQCKEVERENGYIAITSLANIEISEISSKEVTRIDVKELPSEIALSQKPILMAYKYLKHPYGIVLKLEKHEEIPVLSATIDSTSVITLVTEEGNLVTKITYYMKNNKKQFLKLELPENSELWSAFVGGKPVKPAMSKEEKAILIPLESSPDRAFPVEIVYFTKNGEFNYGGSFSLKLPKVDVPISQLSLLLYLPENFEYLRFDSNLKLISYSRYSTGKLGMPDIGSLEMFATKTSQRALLQEQVKEMEEFKGQLRNVMEKGILPIKIEIPQQGKVFHFKKLMVTQSDGLWLNVIYLNSKIYFWFNLAAFLLAFYLVLKALLAFEIEKVGEVLSRKKVQLIGIIVTLIIIKEFLSVTFWFVLLGIFLAFAFAFIHLIYRKITRKRFVEKVGGAQK